MHPLEIAQHTVRKTLDDPMMRVEGSTVQFSYTDETGREYFEGIVENFHSKDAMKVGVMPDFIMVPWKTCDLFFDALARQVEPFLAGRYGSRGCLQLYDHGSIMRVAYEVPVLYAALDDEELAEALSVALVRVIRAIALLRPVFLRMCRSGMTPSFAEIFRAIEREHGFWEVRGFTTSAEDSCVHLPRGLYENLYTRNATRPQ